MDGFDAQEERQADSQRRFTGEYFRWPDDITLKLQILRLGDDIIGPFSGRGFHECADRAGGLGHELAGFFPFDGSVPGHGEQQ